MARATIRVPAFDYEVEFPADDEDELLDGVQSDEIGEIALSKATIVDAVYDEEEDETGANEETPGDTTRSI